MNGLSGYMDGLSCVCGEEGRIHIDVVRAVAECRGCGQRALLRPAEYEADEGSWSNEDEDEERGSA